MTKKRVLTVFWTRSEAIEMAPLVHTLAADAFLIAVPTPFLSCKQDEVPAPDLSYIKAASHAIAPVLKQGDLIILEATSPVGTTEQMADWLALARPDLTFPRTDGEDADINIAHCPERVLPEHVVQELIALANRHPRVNILQPGPGVGGHCIAVDPWFIVSKTPTEAQLIHTARKVNDSKPSWVVEQTKITIANFLQKHPDKTVKNITIACYGLAFKPDIDDLRESPAMQIVKEIAFFHSGKVIAVEPNIHQLPCSLEQVELQSFNVAKSSADIHILLVDHQEFKVESLNSPYLVDTKGIW